MQAAGILFVAPSGKVLLLRRSNEGDAEGTWALPGGKIEDDESATDAAVRECVEEMGYYAGDPGTKLTRRIKDGVDYTTFMKKVDDEFVPKLNNEHTAYIWIKPDEALGDQLRADEAKFNEADHPRASDGRFGNKAGSHEGGTDEPAFNKMQKMVEQGGKRFAQGGKELPPHIQKLKLPPAWKDVQYNPDPKAALQVIGKDAKGRAQYVYSAEHVEKQTIAKFARIRELQAKAKAIAKQNESNRRSADENIRAAADCMALIMAMGVRPGSETDTGAEAQAYGATTLLGKHVSVKGDQVSLKFVGKKGVSLDLPVEDPEIAKMLIERAQEAGKNHQIFPDLNDAKLRAYTHTLDGGGFKVKDFRTLKGTETAQKVMKSIQPPSDPKVYKKAVMQVAKHVSAVLGNTPAIALAAYIDPTVFAKWRMQAGV